jgi:predicted GNAT superfamily acetyltransferase
VARAAAACRRLILPVRAKGRPAPRNGAGLPRCYPPQPCPLSTIDDADAIDRVIEATWGGQHLDHEIVRALAISGNAPWGASAGGELVGYVLGWAGVDAGGLHVHSHMLAALPDRRHKGVGFALKLAQRAQALDQGIHVVRWTFDPLVARNAWFNLGKLGAVADRFERNFYGEMTDDINAGERSDRFTVRWDLDREPGPRDWAAAAASVVVPPEYHDLRTREPDAGRRVRDEAAAAFERCLGDGMVAIAFDRERSAYLFANEDVG